MSRDGVSGQGIKRIRGGRGLGDAIYVRPIVDYVCKLGHAVTVLTDFPQVYIGTGVKTRQFERIKVDVCAHYVGYKSHAGTTQWQDVCKSSGVPIDLPLRFPWRVANPSMVSGLRAQAGGRPLVLVHGGRLPMGRTDGFGIELMPSAEAFGHVLAALRGCFLVQVGKASQVYPLKCEVDLNGSTTVRDIIDLGACCDAVVAQCSFAIPLAEAFNKPLLAVWGSKISGSREKFVRDTTPLKVLSGERDRFVMDDWDPAALRHASSAFMGELAAQKAAA